MRQILRAILATGGQGVHGLRDCSRWNGGSPSSGAREQQRL